MLVAIVLALLSSSVACATAPAEELPEFTVATQWTGTTGTTTLESVGKTSITCGKGTSSGEIAKAHGGSFTFTFKECKSTLGRCNSKGSESGIISLRGASDLVRDFKSESVGALLLLFNETTVECSSSMKEVLKGDASTDESR